MLKYNSNLKKFSRKLRINQTPAERKLWKYLSTYQSKRLIRMTKKLPHRLSQKFRLQITKNSSGYLDSPLCFSMIFVRNF